MKFKINYSHEGTSKILTKVIEASDEKAARAVFHDVYGSNRACMLRSISLQSNVESASQPKNLSGSNLALESKSEAATKLTAYKARQKTKEQEHIWFYTVDSENIAGPVVLASIQNKVDERILKEDSLVMKTGGDWMTVSEFKTTGSPIIDAKPLSVKATASSLHSTQTSYKPSPYSRDAIHFAQEAEKAGSRFAEAPKKYPSLVFSFWIIYLIGSFIVGLISGPLSSFLADQNELNIAEELGLKLDIMVGISFFYTMLAVLMVYLSSTEYKVKNNGFSWHYLAQAIVFLQGLVSLSFALHRL